MAKLHYRYAEWFGEQGTAVELHYFLELRETKCGYWLSEIYGFFMDEESMEKREFDLSHPGFEENKVWVSKTSTKRRAYPTKEEAYTNYLMRKRRQVKILTAQLHSAQEALLIAETKKTELIGDGLARLNKGPLRTPLFVATKAEDF